MTGKGKLTHTPNRRLRIILGAQLLWLATVSVLGGWWASLLIEKSTRIAELEKLAGIATSEDYLERTQRMVIWESVAFFAFLLISTSVLFWLYWRDTRRSKGLQSFFAALTH